MSTTLIKRMSCGCEFLEQLDTHGITSLRVDVCEQEHKTRLGATKAMLNKFTQLKKERNVLRRMLRGEGHSDAGIDTFVESYLSPLEALREIGKIPGVQDALREMEEHNGR